MISLSDISKLNAAFYAEIGTRENPRGSNNVKYNTDYYGHEVSGDNYAWCCAFIWWVFRKCGLAMTFCAGNKTAYCPFVVNWARAHNRWVTSGYQLGDILLYDWNGDGLADHIGWCAGVAGGYAKSIEGNSSDAVRLNSQPFSKIMGAYRPVYSDSTSVSIPTQAPVAPAQSTPKENALNEDGTYTVKSGDNLWMIGQRLGVNYLEIAKANNIQSPYVIRPGQVLTLPGAKKPEIQSNPKDSLETGSSKKSYTVKSGDTLWGIAQRELGSGSRWIEIKKVNNLTSDLIKPGQVLRIP